jgi:ketosteroid isomerase-like protein
VTAPDPLGLLGEVYEHWGRGDWSPRFAFYADDMEWGWSYEFPDLNGVFRDTRTPNPRLLTWLCEWERWTCQVESYLQSGEDIVALTRYRGVGKGSGATVEVEGAHVWRIRDGRVIRLEIFASRRAALASVGLAEE